MKDNNKGTLERLSSLEAKMEVLLDLLREIRQDLKNNPSREEFNTLQQRVNSLEDLQSKLSLKVAGTSAIVALISSVLVAAISNYLFRH